MCRSTSGERHYLHEAQKLVENRENRDGTYKQEDTRDPGVPYTVGTDGGNNITAREVNRINDSMNYKYKNCTNLIHTYLDFRQLPSLYFF